MVPYFTLFIIIDVTRKENKMHSININTRKIDSKNVVFILERLYIICKIITQMINTIIAMLNTILPPGIRLPSVVPLLWLGV